MLKSGPMISQSHPSYIASTPRRNVLNWDALDDTCCEKIVLLSNMYLSVWLSYYFSTTTTWSRLILPTSSLILIDPFAERVGPPWGCKYTPHAVQSDYATYTFSHLPSQRAFALPPNSTQPLRTCPLFGGTRIPDSNIRRLSVPPDMYRYHMIPVTLIFSSPWKIEVWTVLKKIVLYTNMYKQLQIHVHQRRTWYPFTLFYRDAFASQQPLQRLTIRSITIIFLMNV